MGLLSISQLKLNIINRYRIYPHEKVGTSSFLSSIAKVTYQRTQFMFPILVVSIACFIVQIPPLTKFIPCLIVFLFKMFLVQVFILEVFFKKSSIKNSFDSTS